ncbi:EamA-like transporter family protein [Marisediminitalea aggregata]|uniref:EamA-like transporter family protein n=1 Tax=Marisediminitalea aggregata TaxID=634436 RepID=A0A1M5NI27_9ALTE|nr:DMT family transporter [Marisediminitalea aggregata]SHG88603.1 EamA-like transporter family protein [Marisediminitalea aggregata]
MSWILFTLMAVFFQTFRNAIQSKLSATVPTLGVTLSRFLFAAPIAGAYVYALSVWRGEGVPDFSARFWMFVGLAACLQIAATSLMVILFKQKNFAVGAGLAKSEALVAGVLGMLFFGSTLSLLGWVGIIIGAMAVFVLSGWRKGGDLTLKTALIGLACGTCFALTSLYVREASHTLSVSFELAAGWVLFWVLLVQTIMLCAYIGFQQPATFSKLAAQPGKTLAASVTSCLGSIGWFTAMALQHVAYVKTVGQLEVFTTMLISIVWLKQPVRKHETLGLVLIGLAAILVMWT